MTVLFVEYPPCSTCKKAKKYLIDHGVNIESRHIVEATPTVFELTDWIKKSGLPLKRFFNTSGNVYKQLELKDKLAEMTEQEQIQLLASQGMLIKRPLVVFDNHVLVGFKVSEYDKVIKKHS